MIKRGIIMKTVIIGGVAGGASAAARLRRLDEHAQIVIIERGQYVSYATCGLPYYIGGDITSSSSLTLQSPGSFKKRFNIDVRINNEAISIDPLLKKVSIRDLIEDTVYEESYDNLIISTGAKPIIPPITGIDSKKIFTINTIPETTGLKNYIESHNPQSAVVIGGGYIGLEMAENLHKVGLKVTVVEMSDHVVTPLDYDVAAGVHKYLKKTGIDLILSNAVKSVEEIKNKLHLTLDSGSLEADIAILSVGVKPESAIAKNCGMVLNSKGLIITDEHGKTSIENIYAVGDVTEVTDFVSKKTSFIPLAGPANRQGRIVADNINNIKSKYGGTQGTSILKLFDMTVATTGLNEAAARQAGIEYDKTYAYSPSHASYFPGSTEMLLKVLWDKNSLKILGSQIVGYDGVDKRMDIISTAMRLGAKVTELSSLELCYSPPYGSAKDPINMIGFIAENVTNGMIKQFFWNDIATLPNDGSITKIDVRTPREFEQGAIDNFINIPLNDIRQSLDRLPKNKPIYIYCLTGFRSYLACRILQGHGYETYNLAGGYTHYSSI